MVSYSTTPSFVSSSVVQLHENQVCLCMMVSLLCVTHFSHSRVHMHLAGLQALTYDVVRATTFNENFTILNLFLKVLLFNKTLFLTKLKISFSIITIFKINVPVLVSFSKQIYVPKSLRN